LGVIQASLIGDQLRTGRIPAEFPRYARRHSGGTIADGELITVVNSVLEKRLTPPLIINFRAVFLERRKRLAAVLASALPAISAEKMLPFTLHIFLHVPGLWTFCYPRPDSEKLLNEPEHRHLKLDFRREMTLFLEAILKQAVAA
jgi:hypothetical protein